VARAARRRYDLERFVEAQNAGGTYEKALVEIRAGQKQGHWMWFVFPQLAELGRSATAWRYGITSLNEARAYLDHPVLGSRLRESAQAVLEAPSSDVRALLGGLDSKKLRSSMTLFAEAADDDSVFTAVLEKFYRGRKDRTTLMILFGRRS
jgi:uncharacterized protein (DUF1810 family)